MPLLQGSADFGPHSKSFPPRRVFHKLVYASLFPNPPLPKMDDRSTSNALLSPGEELSAQEQEVIDEYVRLADNMKRVRRKTHGRNNAASPHKCCVC